MSEQVIRCIWDNHRYTAYSADPAVRYVIIAVIIIVACSSSQRRQGASCRQAAGKVSYPLLDSPDPSKTQSTVGDGTQSLHRTSASLRCDRVPQKRSSGPYASKLSRLSSVVLARAWGVIIISAGPLSGAEAPGRHAPVGGKLWPPDASRRRCSGGPRGSHSIVALLVVRGDVHLAQAHPSAVSPRLQSLVHTSFQSRMPGCKGCNLHHARLEALIRVTPYCCPIEHLFCICRCKIPQRCTLPERSIHC